MASLIQIRRGTLAEWQAANPILSNGEITFVTDENKIKIGNGTSSWSSLPYLEAAIDADSVVLGQDTTGNYVEIIDGGNGISISGSGSESASVTITNTGVLSLLGTENEITVSASAGDITISLPDTINVNITGSAASLTTSRTISLGGDLSGSASFDGTSDITITASVDSLSSVNSITGTENEINVSASVGDITLSLPETINANTTGTAASLTTARTIALSGDLSGSASFDGSASVDIVATIQPDSVVLGSDTTGNYVSQVTGTGAGISVSGSGESASVTIENTGVVSLSGTENEIDVSASTGSVTLSLPSTINANTTGSAATLTNSRIIALSGDVSGSVTFDGSASVDITTQIQPNSVTLGTDTTGNYIATANGGTGISISGSGTEDAAITISNTGVTSLAGTANQISVSASNGDATLSFPSAVTFPGTVTLNANPQQALEAVTKQYVDAIAEGLHIHASVATATTASVDLNDAPASIDGVSLTDGMRILVKNQPNTADNGIYTYSASADALVRASDFNSSSEIQGGDFLFVTGGNTYADTGWVQTENVTTLGTDPITFTQFSGAGTYSAGTGLQLDGTVFSNTGVLSLQGTANEVEVSASSGAVTISLPETINANTTGSAATLTTSRTIELTGDVTGSASFNGGANATISATIAPNSVELGTDTAGNYIATISGTTDQISVSGSGSENAAVTLSLPSTINVNTSGNSATSTKLATAREIVLSGDVTGSANFDGSASVSISSTLANSGVSANSYGSASATGTFTVDAKGRLTAASNTPIAIAQSAVTNLTTDLSAKAPLASPTFTGTVTVPTLSLTTADTTTAASHYIVETGSDGILRPKTLANVQSEIVTNAAVNSASATILGTVTAGTWNASTISATYIDNAIARLASPALTGTPTAPTAALGTNTTQVATTEFVQSRFSGSTIDTKTASHSLVLADAGKTIEMNVGSANNLTVPLNSSQAFPIGTTIDVIQYGAGQTTIVATGGVTLRSKDGNLKLSGQYSGATLYKRGTDEWLIVGDLTT